VICTTTSKRVALTAVLIAVGAVGRIGIDSVAMLAPVPVYGLLIKIGLTETLTFISGYALGSISGFVTGSSIIVISDMATIPGAWTPFIAMIIGAIGVISGMIRRFVTEPTAKMMGVLAVLLTLMSESLQNAWVAVFYNLPFLTTMLAGLPTLVAALANNVVLFTAVAGRIIKVITDSSVNSN
jgi:uncharacterized membrane protein